MHHESMTSRRSHTTAPALHIAAALCFALLILGAAVGLCGCGDAGETDPFAGRETADLSVYDSMADHDGESRLVLTDAAEVSKLMEQGKTFVVFAGFAECDYCDLLLPYLNDAAEEAGRYVGYIDTRADPEWMTNNDIDDFDLFTACFGEYLDTDDRGEKHLYTPDTYFVKDGQVVARHNGVLEDVDDPEKPLTEGQQEELRQQLAEEFAALK